MNICEQYRVRKEELEKEFWDKIKAALDVLTTDEAKEFAQISAWSINITNVLNIIANPDQEFIVVQRQPNTPIPPQQTQGVV